MPRKSKVIDEPLPVDTEFEPVEEPKKLNVEEVQTEEETKEVKVKKVGDKLSVYNGTALQTASGLKKDDLIINNKGKVVSLKKSLLAKKNFNKQV